MQSESLVLVDLLHVKNEWDACERLRDRVRTIGRLLTNKPSPGDKEKAFEGKCLQTVENVKYNMDVLVPLVKRLAGLYDKVVEIKPPQDEIQAFFKKNHMVPTAKVLNDQAWSIRTLLYVVKGYLYREKPPKDSSPFGLKIFICFFWFFCFRKNLQ